MPVLGGLLIDLLARFGSEKIRGHGIPEALESILMRGSRVEARLAVLKPISSAIDIGGLVEPRALSVGYDVIGELLHGRMALAAILVLAVTRSSIWSISLGSGSPALSVRSPGREPRCARDPVRA